MALGHASASPRAARAPIRDFILGEPPLPRGIRGCRPEVGLLAPGGCLAAPSRGSGGRPVASPQTAGPTRLQWRGPPGFSPALPSPPPPDAARETPRPRPPPPLFSPWVVR